MTIKQGDLQNTVLKKISIDEFEPKTGDSKDVMVLGFHVNESAPGTDLYKFINNSIVEIRDVEVSPNPNEDGYYMVFVEMDRKPGVLDNVKAIVKEVENVAGKLKWNVKTPVLENGMDLDDENLTKFIQQEEGVYLTKDEFQIQQEEIKQQEEQAKLEEEAKSNSSRILEFLQDSNLLEAGINDNKLVMRDNQNIAQLEIINFGHGPDVMKEVGIEESAIKVDFDKVAFSKFNSMLGEMRALPIDDYIVIYNPSRQDVLVTKVI
tara:strand:- start:149 stop:940 length:792 start_codon:yes stop_codon:yes gene_type:complete